MRLFISLLLLVSFSTSLAADWDGVALSDSEQISSSSDLIDNCNLSCDCPDTDGCDGEGCQDCHCCHSHMRYIGQAYSQQKYVLSINRSPNKILTSIYEQPFLESNPRPPKSKITFC